MFCPNRPLYHLRGLETFKKLEEMKQLAIENPRLQFLFLNWKNQLTFEVKYIIVQKESSNLYHLVCFSSFFVIINPNLEVFGYHTCFLPSRFRDLQVILITTIRSKAPWCEPDFDPMWPHMTSQTTFSEYGSFIFIY